VGFKLATGFSEIPVTFPRILPHIAQVDKPMSTPQQLGAAPGIQQTPDKLFGSGSEPGIEPVERLRTWRVLHWPEYAMEGALLGMFMISACLFTVIIEFPGTPIHEAISSAVLRRVLTGIAMGLTAIALIYSSWGQRSGAHFNPSVTLTFLRLGKIKRIDAGFYILFQFAGAVAGVLIAAIALGARISDPSVQYAATFPGPSGAPLAAAGEFAISFLQMTIVLSVSNHPRFTRFTGIAAGLMVAAFIAIEAPYSGMSMNPARTFGSALPAGIWHGFLIYLLVPPAAMLLAAQVFVWRKGESAVRCCKLDHSPKRDCIFCGMKGTAHE
jgi:aquaporin Z